MKAQGPARLELPTNPSRHSVGCCMCGIERRTQDASGQWGYHGVVYPEATLPKGVTLFRCMVAVMKP